MTRAFPCLGLAALLLVVMSAIPCQAGVYGRCLRSARVVTRAFFGADQEIVMTKAFLSLGLAAVVLAVLPLTSCEASGLRTYVSSKGSGTDCTFEAPCADVGTAVRSTGPGGEVHCLDTGPSNFIVGARIDRSITIDCQATIWGIVVDEPGATVTLRNVVVSSFTQMVMSNIGVDFQNGAALILDHCTVQQWNASSSTNPGPAIGIRFAPRDGITASLHVSDSLITGNGLATSGGGIIIQPSGSGSARVLIERTRVENNTYGIFANGMGSTGLISVQVRDSVVSNSVASGISAFTSAGHSVASVVVDHSSSLLSGANGILAQGANAFVFLSESTVMSNVTGLNAVSGGAIFSYQNNRLTGNVSDGAPTAVLTVK
jgi:hypothetical protein